MPKEWKYKFGDVVTPIVQDGNYASKLVVVGRITEEFREHTKYLYVCSHYKLGDYVRSSLLEDEIRLLGENPT